MINTVMICLALNIYFEARNQPIRGQVAVTQVVLNRVADRRYPDRVCDVVYQAKKNRSGKILINKCQFSWYCDGKSDEPTDMDAFRWAIHVALRVLYGFYPDNTHGATHYHSNEVNPKWAISKNKTVVIGDHLFFKWSDEY
jgi:N-acetylmuramoyl-L-alanine amidase